jgi:hypothetical protein
MERSRKQKIGFCKLPARDETKTENQQPQNFMAR